jgi:hypothetical protein
VLTAGIFNYMANKYNSKIETKKQIQKLTQLIEHVLPMDYEKMISFDEFEVDRNAKIENSIPKMLSKDCQDFWTVIERVNSQLSNESDNFQSRFCKFLKTELVNLNNLEKVINFQQSLANLSQKKEISKLLDQTSFAEYYSDDGLLYLGYFLVSRGQEAYYNCLINSSNLEKFLNNVSENKTKIENTEFENLGYISDEVISIIQTKK